MVNGTNSENSTYHVNLVRNVAGVLTTQPGFTQGANNYNPLETTKE